MWQEETESEGVGRGVVVWSLSLPHAGAVSVAPLLKGEHAAPRPATFSAPLRVRRRACDARLAVLRCELAFCCEAAAHRDEASSPLTRPSLHLLRHHSSARSTAYRALTLPPQAAVALPSLPAVR